VGITVDQHDSPAGWLLQGDPSFCFCRSLPAGESWPVGMTVDQHDSPAGWLLQGHRVFAFVGAGLQANRAGQRASPTNTSRCRASGATGRCAEPRSTPRNRRLCPGGGETRSMSLPEAGFSGLMACSLQSRRQRVPGQAGDERRTGCGPGQQFHWAHDVSRGAPGLPASGDTIG